MIVVGQPASALGVLDALASRPAAELRARAQLAAGDLGAAEALARVLLLSSPDDVRSLTLLAEIALARQTPDDARRYLARALAVDPVRPGGARGPGAARATEPAPAIPGARIVMSERADLTPVICDTRHLRIHADALTC